jgi:hypothetical protein
MSESSGISSIAARVVVAVLVGGAVGGTISRVVIGGAVGDESICCGNCTGNGMLESKDMLIDMLMLIDMDIPKKSDSSRSSRKIL